MSKMLLIDDDEAFTRILQEDLENHGYVVDCLECAEDGPDVLKTGEFDLVLLDNRMPRMTGLEFLDELQQQGLRLPVILMTGYDSANTAMEATRRGAFAYAIKPRLDSGEMLQELKPLIDRALAIDWRGEQVRLPGDPGPVDIYRLRIVGSDASERMKEVYRRIDRCARSDASVLIRGDTGTGKELVARAIRARSARKDRPFVVINCTACNEDRLEDELFGHEPGALPGADKLRKGSFEHADGGTLFLDEVGDLPLPIQGKLLGVLGNREVRRRDSSEPIKVNVRVLAATRHNLQDALNKGKFLPELFFRLNAVPIDLPSLHERGPEDLQLLVTYFLAKVADSTGRPAPALDDCAWAKLREYDWPGNIWELQNVIYRAVLLCPPGSPIPAADIEFDERPSSEGEVLDFLRRAIGAGLRSGQGNLVAYLRDILNRELFLLTMNRCNGNPEKAELILGVPLANLLHEANGAASSGNHRPSKTERPIAFQTEALVLIRNHPEWTVEQYMAKLHCSKSALYRDSIINRALQARKR